MREGFLLVGRDDPGPLASAVLGETVAKPALGPPWFAVNHTLERVLLTAWPARLLRVAMLPASTPEEQANLEFAASGIRADAGYTRVLAVKVLEELSPSILFGPHGDRVAAIADAAAGLTLQQATWLARLRKRDAGPARDRVWQRWLRQRGPRSYVDEMQDPYGSPIGGAMSLLFHLVWRSAKARGGPDAFRPDPEPEEEGDEILQQPWYDASVSLIDAALAIGAPQLLEGDEGDVLCHAWREHRRPHKTSKVMLHEERTESSWRTLTARMAEGDLRIDGQDLSRTMGEYEWAYTIKAADLPALMDALGGSDGDDLLTLLATHCTGREADRRLRELLGQNNIPYGFWSRIDE